MNPGGEDGGDSQSGVGLDNRIRESRAGRSYLGVELLKLLVEVGGNEILNLTILEGQS